MLRVRLPSLVCSLLLADLIDLHLLACLAMHCKAKRRRADRQPLSVGLRGGLRERHGRAAPAVDQEAKAGPAGARLRGAQRGNLPAHLS